MICLACTGSTRALSGHEMDCKKMVRAKKVAKVEYSSELAKCMDNPTTYQ